MGNWEGIEPALKTASALLAKARAAYEMPQPPTSRSALSVITDSVLVLSGDRAATGRSAG